MTSGRRSPAAVRGRRGALLGLAIGLGFAAGLALLAATRGREVPLGTDGRSAVDVVRAIVALPLGLLLTGGIAGGFGAGVRTRAQAAALALVASAPLVGALLVSGVARARRGGPPVPGTWLAAVALLGVAGMIGAVSWRGRARR